MKSNKLKGKIIEKGMNVEQLAQQMGIDVSTFYRKLNNFDKFTVGDVICIKNVLGLTTQETSEIFIA